MLKTNSLEDEKKLLLTGSLLSPDLTEEVQKAIFSSSSSSLLSPFKSIKAGFIQGLNLMGATQGAEDG